MERKHIICTRYFSDVRCLLQCLTIPSTLGAVPFFILAATAWAAIPLLAAIVLDVTPEAHRGFFQGAIVTLATLPGFLAPFVTGLLVHTNSRPVIE
jgi:MFS family permease